MEAIRWYHAIELRPGLRTPGLDDPRRRLGMLRLPDPLGALERVARVTRDQLIVETHVDCTYTRRPSAALYAGHELRFDPTNWWGPNPEAVVAMLRAAGFARVEVVSRDSTPYRL